MFIFTSLLLAVSCSDNFNSASPNTETKNDKTKNTYSPNVIYGDDNRLDLYQVNNEMLLELEQAVAGLVRNYNINKNNNGTYSINTKVFGTAKKLCSNEPFREQRVSSFCSSFLVNKDTLITAGHCILNQTQCEKTYFVFGLSQYEKSKPINYNNIEEKNVYRCKELIYSIAESSDGKDFAVIQLDREVKERTALKFRRYGRANIGTKTVLIGKPSGIPTKVAAGGRVISYARNSFQSDNDAYAGNSGSPVFNESTGTVEGILVKGSLDFKKNTEKNCTESHVCSDVKDQTVCGGEFSQYISDITPFVDSNEGLQVFENKNKIDIPDYDSTGVNSKIEVTMPETNTQPQFIIHVNVSHSWAGDLKVILKRPNGKQLILFENNGKFGSDLIFSFGESDEQQEKLKELILAAGNEWTLHIIDEFSRDQGQLNSWAIEIR